LPTGVGSAAALDNEGHRLRRLTFRLLYANVIHATLNETGNAIMPSSVLSVRLSDQERTLLEAASSQARTNVSDFVRRKALEAAETDMLERRIVTVPAKDWERFEAWAAKPARQIAGLRALARTPPTWRK
jgi:uncharacterized protein (DUF1778 family)